MDIQAVARSLRTPLHGMIPSQFLSGTGARPATPGTQGDIRALCCTTGSTVGSLTDVRGELAGGRAAIRPRGPRVPVDQITVICAASEVRISPRAAGDERKHSWRGIEGGRKY